jgi:guanylate kinase
VEKSFPDIISIFIIPPSVEALRERLTGRGQDNSAIIERRMKEAVSEMQHYDEFDYLVVNDDFDIALNELSTIIHSQRLNINQQSIKHQDLLKALIR